MKKRTRNTLIAAGAAAVSGFGICAAASYYIAKKFVGIAMDRTPPNMMQNQMEQLAGSTDTAATEQMQQLRARMDAAKERLLQSEIETVELQSHDGLTLVGHYKPVPNPKRLVIAVHGWRSSWTYDFGIISEFWEQNDCSVLYIEQRGIGSSEGEYITFGLLERYDCLAWIHWAVEKTGGALPIYLSGISMGSTTVMMTAGFDLPKQVKGMSADCGFLSPHAIWKHVASNNLHIPYDGMPAFFADRMSKKKVRLSSKAYSTLDAMKVCKVPILFIHGTDDHFVPIEMTYQNYRACASEKELVIVPGAEHGMSYIVEQEKCQQKLKEFWAKHDA